MLALMWGSVVGGEGFGAVALQQEGAALGDLGELRGQRFDLGRHADRGALSSTKCVSCASTSACGQLGCCRAGG